MATTAPDGIISPDADQPVDFAGDMAVLASSVQTALSNRATKSGTSAQRSAATGVREGTLWFDTTTQSLWLFTSGTWVPAGAQDSGVQTATGIISTTGGASLSSFRATRVGNMVTLQGVASGTFGPPSTQFGDVAAAWRPAINSVGVARFSATGYRDGTVRLLTSGAIYFWMAGSGSQGGAEFSITYVVP